MGIVLCSRTRAEVTGGQLIQYLTDRVFFLLRSRKQIQISMFFLGFFFFVEYSNFSSYSGVGDLKTES